MELVEGSVEIDDLDTFLTALGTIADRYDCAIQAFDSSYVVDREHLERAVELANRSIERTENVADDRSVEILLYAAGRRQIDRAFEMGVAEGVQDVVIVVDGTGTGAATGTDDSGESAGGIEGDEAGAVEELRELVTAAPVLNGYDEERVREFFEITDAELAATTGTLADVVRERVALLDVEK